ncbi:TonB-dependent receptor [Chiayiivirga flava]|uniref:Iron complex outermembrane receptor protein n=1 Tax=Chiayiivirga flava TaxID=659595 RepID=A0A7W8G0K4_9GAMM|nr:TonB-dependent receptor [Chiayiivirga flava]MBB5207863.1 iron complex outermembrane receptor protein [Chiayiivirga flava]
MLILKRNLLSAALASAILVTAQAAHAQSAAAPPPADGDAQALDTATLVAQVDADTRTRDDGEATELDQVVVTGIRAGIESAIEVKRESTSIVDVVSSEDLGKLPDISIADSIARLPGLAAQRVAGRASTVSIRGLSSDYGTTLLNGREQVSVGDNRGVEFDQFPSELINQVVVYKTPDASLVGQGLSGTVDLRTVRPLSFLDRTVAFNVRGEKNSLGELNGDSDDMGSRVSAFYVDQFADDRLGIALGYARLDSPGQAERWESYGYPTDNAGSPGNFVLGGSKSMASSTDNVRQGLMGVLEFNASDTYSTVLDVYYSKFEKAETTRFLEAGLGWSGAQLINPVVENGAVVGGTFTGVRPVIRNDLNEGDDKLFAIGWNNQFTFSEDWSAELDLSHSKADRNESILETYAGARAGVFDTVDFRLDPEGPPSLSFGADYTDPAYVVLTDPGGWGQDGYIKTPQVEDELTSYRGSVERSFADGPFRSVEFGLNYADREKTRSVPEAFLDLLADETTVPGGLLLNPVDLSFSGIPGSLAYDINDVLAQFYTLRDNINADIVNKQWTVQEKMTTGYAQLNIDTDLGSVGMRGNIGVQAVQTDQSSNGFIVLQGNAAEAIPYDGGADYTDYLPSLNLAFGFPSDNTLRLGLGRQMARPRIDQMRANNNTSLEFTGVNQGRWTRSGGNPELEPWIANAVDLSWEKYFAERGYVSLAYFYKDLRTYVYDLTTSFDTAGLPIPDGYEGPTPDPVGFYTRPANGEGGTIKGYEFSLSVPFDLFTPALEGFGFIANYSDTSSSIKRLGPDGPDEPIAGLSEKVQNIAVYFERAGFSTRVSQRKRSDFLGEIQGFGADRAQVYIDGESVVDLQIGYSFGEGAFDGVSVLLQANNVTNEPYRQYFPGNGLTQRYEEYGRQYLLGVSYKF